MTGHSLENLQELLQQEKRRSNAILNHISEGVIQLNTQFEIEDINVKAESLCECEKALVLHQPITDIVSIFDEQSQAPIPFTAENADGQQTSTQRLLVNKDHHQRLIESFYCLLKNENDEVFGYLFIFRDITAQDSDPDHLQWESSHDNLTGLVNRDEMESRLETSLKNVKTHNIFSVFLMVDIDQFKKINQHFDLKAADEYLQRISLLLLKHLRARDTLARIENDTFGVLLENCLIDNATMIANKIKSAVKNYRFIWNGRVVKLSASVGVLSLNNQSIHAKNIIRDAESATQKAKSKGGDAIYVHKKNDAQIAQQREQVSIIAEINHALSNNRFRLFFQPIYSVTKEKIAHWEVLIRLVDHDDNILSPYEFLPAAEKFGLITYIDAWVFKNITQLLETLTDIPNLPRLAINLSPNSLEDDQCKSMIIKTLKEKPLLQGKLIFEITETTALSNIDSINDYLAELKRLGCLLALDDFGTGVSTYSYLKSLDVDMIKIDGEFINTIQENPINQEIVRSLTKIAHLMNITTTAEWVCDKGVYHYLSKLGMDYYQGYFISEPLSQEQFIELVQAPDHQWIKKMEPD